MDLRTLGDLFARTPLHPQWLMRTTTLHPALRSAEGVVLDIGAASQWAKKQLAKAAFYIPLDYPETAENLYRTRPAVFADAQQLPFPDASVDAVICREVLEHVSAPLSSLQEIYRVLKPGGVAECSMPFLYPIHDAPYDYTRWTVHAWQLNAKRCGLQVVHVDPAPHQLYCAAALFAIALTAPLQNAQRFRFLLLPTAAALVLIANLGAWTMARIWPRWSGMATGYRVLLSKP